MSKRNKEIIETRESLALKSIRVNQKRSLSFVADSLNLSRARVHQFEQGRETITQEYVSSFLKVMELKEEEWNKLIGKECRNDDLRKKCIELLNGLDNSKLEVVYGLLSNL